jgi:hypothetical protein
MWNRHALGLLLLLFAAGCEADPAAEPGVRVLGRVSWLGRPLTRGHIIFAADPSACAHQELAIGVLHFDGSYELATPAGRPPRPGWYRVTLVSDDRAIVLPSKYADPLLSGLSATVAGPGPQRLDWELP